MDEAKFAELIRPLEAFAAAKPGLYRLRIALLAALGYVYLLVVVSVLLAIVVLTLVYMRINWVVIKILWIPLVLVGLVLRSLWITIPEPDGMKLEREQAPAECGALQGDVQCVVAEAADRFSVQLTAW